MFAHILCIALIATTCVAQDFWYPVWNLSVPLYVPVSNQIDPTSTLEDIPAHIYRFYVPKEAINVTIEFFSSSSNSGSDNDCNWMDVWAAPLLGICQSGYQTIDNTPGGEYLCPGTTSVENFDASPGNTVNATYLSYGGSSYGLPWAAGVDWYLAVTKEGLNNDSTCAYTIQSITIFECPNNTLPTTYGGVTYCSEVIEVGNDDDYIPVNVSSINNPNGVIIATYVPAETMAIYFNFTTDNIEVEVYGGSLAPVDGGNQGWASCEGASQNIVPGNGTFYTYSLVCYLPVEGDFYIWISPQGTPTNFTGVGNVWYETCEDKGNFGGINCTVPTHALSNITHETAKIYIGEQSYAYWYLDIEEWDSGFPINISITTNSTDLYSVVAWNAYPSYTDPQNYPNEDFFLNSNPINWIITEAEAVSGGRWYFAAYQSDSSICWVQVALNFNDPIPSASTSTSTSISTSTSTSTFSPSSTSTSTSTSVTGRTSAFPTKTTETTDSNSESSSANTASTSSSHFHPNVTGVTISRTASSSSGSSSMSSSASSSETGNHAGSNVLVVCSALIAILCFSL